MFSFFFILWNTTDKSIDKVIGTSASADPLRTHISFGSE